MNEEQIALLNEILDDENNSIVCFRYSRGFIRDFYSMREALNKVLSWCNWDGEGECPVCGRDRLDD